MLTIFMGVCCIGGGVCLVIKGIQTIIEKFKK